MTSICDHLFVYGTLRSGQSPFAALVATHFTLLGKAVVQGRLFEIAGYPGMLLSPHSSDKVFGELHVRSGSASVWDSLDAYEGCSPHFPEPHEYVRREVPVLLLAEQRWLSAWTWLYNWPVSMERRILSGDYYALNIPAEAHVAGPTSTGARNALDKPAEDHVAGHIFTGDEPNR